MQIRKYTKSHIKVKMSFTVDSSWAKYYLSSMKWSEYNNNTPSHFPCSIVDHYILGLGYLGGEACRRNCVEKKMKKRIVWNSQIHYNFKTNKNERWKLINNTLVSSKIYCLCLKMHIAIKEHIQLKFLYVQFVTIIVTLFIKKYIRHITWIFAIKHKDNQARY